MNVEASVSGEAAAPIGQLRADYRRHGVPRHYSGRRHFAFTSLFSLAGIGSCLLSLRGPMGWELLTVPLTFVYANFVEYMGHRGPMHHLQRPLAIIFDKHTNIHHRLFPQNAFAYEDHRDFHAVLLSPVVILLFFSLFALPVGGILFSVLSPNVGYLFVATALGYFLSYEWLHFCYHSPETSWVYRIPFMRSLRRLHLAHHDPAQMTRYNFNITYPLCDWLFGTLLLLSGEPSPSEPAPPRPAGVSRPRAS